MTYSRSTLVESLRAMADTLSGDAIEAWLETSAASGAKYVGLPQVPIPPGIGFAILHWCLLYPIETQGVVRIIDPYVVAAQVRHESASCQSRIARDKRNYSGYGAENDDPYGKAHTFASPFDGIGMQVRHLLGYVAGDGPWNATHEQAPRYHDIVKPKGWAGTVNRLHELEQKWAYTAPAKYAATPLEGRYGAKLAEAANDLVAFASTFGGPPMTTPYEHIVPGMVDARSQLATAKQNQGGVKRGPYETIPITQKRGVVVHYRGVVTDAGAGLASFKADATYHVGKNWVSAGQPPVLGSGIMYHVGIPGDGTVYLLRDLDRVLWHCGAWPQNENTFAIQLPLGGNQQATAAQLAALKRVVDALLAFSGAPRAEVWGHQELSPTTCPGTLMDAFVRPYRAAGGTPPVDDGNPWFLHLGGGVMAQFAFRRGFRGVVEGLAIARYSADTNSAALSLTGEPIEEEWTGVDGNAYQRCKRVTLRYEPGNAAPWDVHFEAADMPLPERAA